MKQKTYKPYIEFRWKREKAGIKKFCRKSSTALLKQHTTAVYWTIYIYVKLAFRLLSGKKAFITFKAASPVAKINTAARAKIAVMKPAVALSSDYSYWSCEPTLSMVCITMKAMYRQKLQRVNSRRQRNRQLEEQGRCLR